MFNDKTYVQVNREERFYCALLAHALLSSATVRLGFCELVMREFKFDLKPDEFAIYLEVAALRDYWADLGNSIVYDKCTHAKRRKVLEAILSDCGLPASTIDRHQLFWTSNQRRKLWSPGRWETGAIVKISKDDRKFEELLKIKWAFNVKPDILIVSNKIAVVIEAKLESSEGKNSISGYAQKEIQERVSGLLKLLVPAFQDYAFHNVALELNPKQGISWAKIVDLLKVGAVDDFTSSCFEQLRKRYYG